MTEKEKHLIEISRRLESQKCIDDWLLFGEGMLRAQDAMKKDYGIPSNSKTIGGGMEKRRL